jgi:Rad3-related DNA helicase
MKYAILYNALQSTFNWNFMDYVRIGAMSPPESGRAAWARDLLVSAKEAGLKPLTVPIHEVVGFTANLPPHLAKWLKGVADECGASPAVASAGLIAAAQAGHGCRSESEPEQVEPELSWMREINIELHPLAKAADEAISRGKIAFCEAATGTGKGRMILALAVKAVEERKRVVISAPLSVAWQLMAELHDHFPGALPSVAIVLGRANFVCPEALLDWARDQDAEPTRLIEWIESGGKPASPESVRQSAQLGVELCWLAEDASSFVDDLPGDVLLEGQNADDEDGGHDCPAEAVYRALNRSAVDAELILCSHHQLAFHSRQMLYQSTFALPVKIDLLVVDEAHLLETTFSAISSTSLHLHGLTRFLNSAGLTGKKAAIEACAEFSKKLFHSIARNQGKPLFGSAQDMQWLSDSIKDFSTGLEKVKAKKNSPAARRLAMTKATLQSALSGYSSIRVDLTPVLGYPVFTTGQANLDSAFRRIWESVGAAALVSATLYTGEGSASTTGGLIRWKLAVPKERAAYIPPVIPAWIKAPVTLQVETSVREPDESAEWHRELAARIERISSTATGGTLVLATSHTTVLALEQLLTTTLGNRLLAQRPGTSAASLAATFRSHGCRPVWIGVGAAWTGIDLSNKAVDADQDNTLSDLVICRLPFGVTRSLPHYRRQQMIGMSAVIQETSWTFRQGIGRLVRRKGCPPKSLWILDRRLHENATWGSLLRGQIAGYKRASV